MFKPFKGVCNECNKPRWIVVRAGLCDLCNKRKKKEANLSRIRIAKDIPEIYEAPETIHRSRKPTGELALFKEMWQETLENSGDEGPRCRCCNNKLGFAFSVTFFSHLLSKGLYPAYRLRKENIWIICFDCHYDWGNGSRNQPKFALKNREYERLKIQYNHELH